MGCLRWDSMSVFSLEMRALAFFSTPQAVPIFWMVSRISAIVKLPVGRVGMCSCFRYWISLVFSW